ncbi:chromodomain-helicase-DNA-binding protein 8 isoform X2 [Amia ocellicauda]|uniref:chromodomain-helicase-DNA-binding protein 8 isoform X2 n=1 Tax=Amia ocellicauda TaxID=2972642 RepID=UPI0034641B6D
MADPIMELFDDPSLFSLDTLTEETFPQGSGDPIEEALQLALDQVSTPAPAPTPAAAPQIPTPTVTVTVGQRVAGAQAAPQTLQLGSLVANDPENTLAPSSSVAAPTTMLLSSPLAVPVSTSAQAAGQTPPKIVILKAPSGVGATTTSPPGQQGQQLLHATLQPAGAANASATQGKVTIAKVLTGTPLRPGVSIVSGGTVLNATPQAQTQVQVQSKPGSGVQRLVQTSNGPLKQVLLTSVPAQPNQGQNQAQLQVTGGGTATVRPPGVTLTSVPQQGEAKRITLVLQQPQQAGGAAAGGVNVAGGGQPRLVLGSLPGKLVLQGGQLAALSQARAGQPGGQPKVLTIQLQVQQQPNAQGAKFQLVSQGSTAGGQLVQISQGQGQRLAVPLKLLLQPQAGSSQTTGGAPGSVSVVKVISASPAAATAAVASSSATTTTTTTDASALPRAPQVSESTRRLEHLRKQEKANRIVAEAIARAKARGERNIPRVLNQDELPAVAPGSQAEAGGAAGSSAGKKKSGGGGSKKKGGGGGGGGGKSAAKKSSKGTMGAGAAGGSAAGGGKSKSKVKPNTITPVVGKKRKRTGSSENSDGELSPAASPRGEEDDSNLQKRRSNRQVKRKKYTEDLDIKITDDEDEPEEDVDVTTATGMGGSTMVTLGVPGGGGRTGGGAMVMGLQQPQLQEPIGGQQLAEGDGLPAMQFFVENPSEEDAAIVDKVLSMRLTKKEVSNGQYINVEEFFVKYKNYSYLHCEWATMQQLERDKRINQKLKRFKTKMAQMRHLFQEDEEPFNPDYVEVDRILDESHSVDKDNGEPVVYYLVKWCSLPYEDSTWELQEDVDEGKVEEFKKIQSRQPCLKRVARPPASSWKKLDLSREYKGGNTLREYQLEGVNWLLFNWYNRQNCILADEMGLGKTIQSIALLSEVHRAGLRGPFLVIAPLSTIANWEREFASWTSMNAIVYHGSLGSRQMIQQYEMYCRDDKGHLIPGAYKFDALITTFEMVLSDCPELREIAWRCVVIDEAHRLKNRNCKLLDSLNMLDLEHKILLTGTPLQNTVEELFSLLHFLEPSQFPSESEFLKDFGDLKTEEQVQKLQAVLKPMMLRRLKEDVEKNLAPKQETIIEVELTAAQKRYYRAILERNFSFLSQGATQSSNVPNLLNAMMELRKCCNHPYLITGAEEQILAEMRHICDPMAPDFHLQSLVRSAGKLVLIDKLLPRLRAGGHKVLIFSQMVRCLDILEDYLIQKRYLYERIDGRVRGNLRQAAIDRFSKPDSDRFVFLLCTRAGGLGINLTAADTCIIFDSDWNPQNDLQAQARCHRIGQSKAVKVYRLITRNSYEREMFDKASLKLGLDKAVLQSMSGKENNVNGMQQFSKKEIEDLLRKGAYAAIMDEGDEENKFCEEDIDQILQRRATTITIESQGKGSTFSKASFIASDNRTDIALDDPNFWQKWAKRADIDLDSINRKNTLVIDTPRVRKQTRQFSSLRDDEAADLSDLDSEEDERPRSRRSDRHHGYGRTDCFRVEKHLLVYGWGRWRDILAHARFKRRLCERDVETICRVILVYCLLHYRGDENIKSFIWELIAPPENGRARTLLNHSGLSIPVPRGRKGKRVKAQSSFDVQKVEWIRKYNPDCLLLDDSYRKHLKHQCNKVLLRVRMLYYLRQEVIGDHADRVLRGADSREIDIWIPEVEQVEVPSRWWDAEADKSLLLGVFKHGYEKYTTMRADPCLCFLERVGRPDDKAIDAEQRSADTEMGEGGEFEKYSEDPEFKPLTGMGKERDEEGDPMLMDEEICVVDGDETQTSQAGASYWPTGSSLTARLRRLITAYQRSYRREQLKMEAAEKGDRRRRRCEAAYKLKEIARRERQQRWTRREECDFYRVVSTFGVELAPVSGPEAGVGLDWRRFRTFARLDKKTDESLSRYYTLFTSMCRRVCHLPPQPGEEPPDTSGSIAPITEERASRTLYRIGLLRRIREQVLPHPALEERLGLVQPSSDLPLWWRTPQHDRELLQGASRHGVSRTEQSVFPDPDYSFQQARVTFLQQNPALLRPAPPSRSSTPSLPGQSQGHNLSLAENSLLSTSTDSAPSGWGLDRAAGPETHRPVAVKMEGPESHLHLAEDGSSLPSLQPHAPPSSSDAFTGNLSIPPQRSRPGWSWKKRRGGEEGEGQSDWDSDSDSDSSTSSNRSALSDDSDSDTEIKREGEAVALKPCDLDEESRLSLTPSQEGGAAEGPALERLRVEWPKDRVLINRLDSICVAVLTGRWVGGRRVTSDPHLAQSSSSSSSSSSQPGAPEEQGMAERGERERGGRGGGYTRVLPRKHVVKTDPESSETDRAPDTAFTVRVLREEGLKLTFQKQALPNGSEARKGRRRHETPQEEYPDANVRVPVVHLYTRSVLTGDDAPRRVELSDWLKKNPEYEVEPAALEVLLSSTQVRKGRGGKRRRERAREVDAAGAQRVQLLNLRTGRKLGGAFAPSLRSLAQFLQENTDYAVTAEWGQAVRDSGYLPESMFDRILTQDIKKPPRRPRPTQSLASLHLQAQLGDPLLGSTHPVPPLALEQQQQQQQQPEMELELELEEEEEEEDEEEGHSSFSDITSPHFPPNFLQGGYDVKMEAELGECGTLEIGGGDSLSQSYDGSDQDAGLMEDPMLSKHSDTSSSSED